MTHHRWLGLALLVVAIGCSRTQLSEDGGSAERGAAGDQGAAAGGVRSTSAEGGTSGRGLAEELGGVAGIPWSSIELDKGHHLLLASRLPWRDRAAVAVSGPVFGVVFIEGDRLCFGVSSDIVQGADSVSLVELSGSFADVAEHVVALDLVGDEEGFVLTLVVRQGDGPDRRILIARLSPKGTVVEGPLEVAGGSGLSCDAAAGSGVAAITCSERQADDQCSFWLALCPHGQQCIERRLSTGDCVAIPAVVWDSAAFDVVYHDAATASLMLAGFSPSGEGVTSPVILVDTVHSTDWNSPGLAFDGTCLAIASGSKFYLFDVKGTAGGESWPLATRHVESGAWVTAPTHEVVATSTGYVVVSHGESDAGARTRVSVAVGDGEFSLLGEFHDIALTQVGPHLIGVTRDGRVLAELDPSTLSARRAPQWLGSRPRAPSPRAVRCDARTCYLLAAEAVPDLRDSHVRHGVWTVERATDQLTPPADDLAVLGGAVGSPAMTTSQAAMVVSGPDEDDEWRLVLWNFGERSNAMQVVPWSDADGTGRLSNPHEGSSLSLFFEGTALRGFYGDLVEDSILYERLFEDGQLESESAVGIVGGQCQSGDSYFGWELTLQSDEGPVTRWRPGSESGFSPWAGISVDSFPRNFCCSGELVSLNGSVYAMAGESVATVPLERYGCTAAGESLAFLGGYPESSESGIVLLAADPDGTMSGVVLDLPEGYSSSTTRLLDWSNDAVVMVWDAESEQGEYLRTYLSTWRDPRDSRSY